MAARLPDGDEHGLPQFMTDPEKPVSLKDVVLAAGRQQVRSVGWREGDAVADQPVIALRVRPANDAQCDEDGVLARTVAVAEWPADTDEPVKYWLRNRPDQTPIATLVRLAKLRWRVEHDYRELKQCLGLDHYEGGTFGGLHHHLTCVTVAHAFLTYCRLIRGDPHRARPQTAAA